MTASKIMVIRHAEKPDDASTVIGVTIEGHQAPQELTVRGWQRAGALATFFAPPDAHFRDQRIEKPLMIFASRVAPHSKSLRPQHTVEPLAELIGREKLRLDFSEGEEQQLLRLLWLWTAWSLSPGNTKLYPRLRTCSWATTLHPENGIKSGSIWSGSLLG
jgi:broad specificity phosphatase PhoE